MPEIEKFKPARVWRRSLGAGTVEPRRYPQKRLKISRDTFTATVTFEKQSEVWIAASVPYCLTYLRGVLAKDFKREIEAEGFTWEWIP